MRVKEIMTTQVQTCRPEDSLEKAAQLMWDHDCGCLPVCSDAGNGAGWTVGVITDRDICMNALFQGKPMRDLRVGDVMAKEVRVCRPDDSIAQAEKIMQEARIRRLPVVEATGALIGMISLADLARQAARERTRPRKDITESEVGDTLAAICQPIQQPLAA
jgi:CBS domain-containing protein